MVTIRFQEYVVRMGKRDRYDHMRNVVPEAGIDDTMTSSIGNIFPRYWPFVRGIHRSPVNSPHKGQWHGALIFSLICAWINGWVNKREAGDLRRHRAHYDVIVMAGTSNCIPQCLWDVITYHCPSLDTCAWQSTTLIWNTYNAVYKVRALFCLLLC